jgi:hypothetical protein
MVAMHRIATAAAALSCASLACGGGDHGGAPDGGPAAAGWTYHAIDGARCGNGSPWGVATSVQPGATEVVVFLAGGGACWDSATCFELGAAVHVAEDLPSATVLAEARALEGWLFSRQANLAPFPTASFVYLPYCTGDLHAGRRVASYPVGAGTREVHHLGAANLDRLLAGWDDLLPPPGRLWLAGVSAGGFGATLNWWRFRARFPAAAAIDVIDDSGPAIDVPAGRFADWVAAWELEQPAGCADCADGLSLLLPHYAAALPASDRYAYLGYEADAVIALYYGEGADVIAAKHAALRTALEAEPRFGGFFLAGGDHVVLADPTRSTTSGVSAATWIDQLIDGSPGWATTGP